MQENLNVENKVVVVHKIGYKDCEIWFVRFSMDLEQKVLALGNQVFKGTLTKKLDFFLKSG